MNYFALNAKVHAMYGSAKSGEGVSYAFCRTQILRWVQDKKLRSFIADVFPMESVWRDIAHFMHVWARLHRLDRANRNALIPAMGAEIDLTNIVWMYRLKKFYGVTGSEVFGRLIPVRYRLSEGEMRTIAQAKDVEVPSMYASVLQDFTQPEQKIRREIARLYKKQARLHPQSLANVCALLRMME
ncbi:MAG: V-type ATPase subunit [Defluviitaleaceae bacterium]|nr:V-type ATPase subunit [Defluviitaleaceae bacterium]MCL2276244.1 V-type ATPase subunit [Defluviitaleaceae bacterium]